MTLGNARQLGVRHLIASVPQRYLPPRSGVGSYTLSLLLSGYQPIVVLRVLLIGFSSN
jgi:hypothetical protein